MKPAEDYILNQTEPFRSILLHLQSVIEHTIPELVLKYKYRIPYYYCNEKPYCYLNQSKDYVDLGFWNGAHLSVHLDVLNRPKNTFTLGLIGFPELRRKTTICPACQIASAIGPFRLFQNSCN